MKKTIIALILIFMPVSFASASAAFIASTTATNSSINASLALNTKKANERKALAKETKEKFLNDFVPKKEDFNCFNSKDIKNKGL